MVDLPEPFLEELSRQLGDALGAGPGTGVDIVIDAEDVEMGSDQAISLALLLTEAVSNAMRHGFPDDHVGTISISLHIEDDMAQLVVADDGVGLGDATSEGDGLGLYLARGILAAQQGTILLDSKPGMGTVVEITLETAEEES